MTERDRVELCHIVQDTVFNPFDGRGLDLVCLTHDRQFNIKGPKGEWNIPTPAVCPAVSVRVSDETDKA